ncbi:nitrilase-related carbon-nitrogen hydrolase [Falsiroseomonas sp.]|uniref:nitrilase-related carbon-nitrogen hydrolase n=1 Tax=Falsiroseomonas sp. TaxID=2870721 RepID=UPI0035629195
MTERLHIALAQFNARPGDLVGNAARLRAAWAEAAALGADIVVTPALSLAGQAAGDAGFDTAAQEAVAALAATTAEGGPALLVGAPRVEQGKRHDAVFLLDAGRIAAHRARHEVARGEPFDPGPAPGPVNIRGVRLGLMIGADWHGPAVAETLSETGAELLVAVDAAPFVPGAAARRVDLAVARVVETGLGFAYCNRVGGQGEAVFDGGGFVLNPDRGLAAQLPQFESELHVTEWARDAEGLSCLAQLLAPPLDPLEARWRAMMLGLADAVAGRGLSAALVPLSGGLGEALAAALAVDALGPRHVRAVVLPAPDWPAARIAAAEACASLLGIGCDMTPLAPALAGFAAMLGPEAVAPVAEVRRLALASLSRRLGALPVGDALAEGHAPLAGLDAATAVALARWRNAGRPAGARGPAGMVVPGPLIEHFPSTPGMTDPER